MGQSKVRCRLLSLQLSAVHADIIPSLDASRASNQKCGHASEWDQCCPIPYSPTSAWWMDRLDGAENGPGIDPERMLGTLWENW